ncbi:MAG: glycosyltransferase family A protein [Rhodospirillaceae bacterium]|nr:glycosyltransferase family A protein [Rhodospirillaceae bacterium]
MVQHMPLRAADRAAEKWLHPCLTVLIATYNGADTLPRTLAALGEVNVPDGGWKIVIVDDGSADDSASIVNGFRGRLPLTFIQRPHGGKNAALNAGLAEIEGDLVVFIDDDVLPDRDWLLRLRAVADSQEAYSIFGGAIRPSWESEPEAWMREIVRPGPVWGLIERDEGPCYHTLAFGGNMAVRAEIFRRGYRFNETVGPDGTPLYRIGSETELQFRLHRDGYLTWHCPAAIVRHIISQAEITESWILRRAERFGRGQSAIGYDVPGRWRVRMGGVPVDLRLRMIFTRVLGALCSIVGADKARLKALWQNRFLRGVAHERRLAARSRVRPERLPVPHQQNSDKPQTVSIIISNYNYAAFVGEALQSALNQTASVHEVIVVDDGSTDGSREILERFRGDPRVHLVFQKNGGQASAINRGFQASHGDLVMFLDADDVLRPEAVETILAKWQPGASRCQFALETIDATGTVLGLHPLAQIVEHGEIFWKLVVAGQYRYMPTSAHAFSRHALESLLPMPEGEWRLCADTYLVTTTTAFGPVLNLPDTLGLYRVHEQNRWYLDVIDEARMRVVWRQHIQVWRSLVMVLANAARTNDGERMRYECARLYLLRRIVALCLRDPHLLSRASQRDATRFAIGETLGSPLPIRWRLLYFALFVGARAGVTRLPAVRRWVMHRKFRPGPVRRLIDWLKADGFYDWMSPAGPPDPAPEFALGRKLQFGIGQEVEPHLWYGWERSLIACGVVVGATAALVGRLPANCSTLDIEMAIEPRLIGPVTSQRIEIQANGTTVYRGTLSGARQIRAKVNQRLFRDRSSLVLSVRCPDFVVPRLVDPDSGDTKPQGFTFRWIRLRPILSAQQASYPALPARRTVEFSEPSSLRYLDSGWHRPVTEGVRMARRYGSLRFSVLRGSAQDHILTLWFSPERRRGLSSSLIRILCGEIEIGRVDLVQCTRISVMVPVPWDSRYWTDNSYGISPAHGKVTLTLVADQFIPMSAEEAGESVAVGPCLRRLVLDQANLPVGVPHFSLGRHMEFREAGIGLRHLTSGWHSPDASGTFSADVCGHIRGVVISDCRDIGVSAIVAPPTTDGPFAQQEVALECNGQVLARCRLSERSEITAIVPQRLIGPDRVADFSLRSNVVGRLTGFAIGSESRAVGVKLEMLTLQ